MLSSMGSDPYSVSIVLDREFGPRLRDLLKLGPVWAVDTQANRETAQVLWKENPSGNHLDGITIFNAASDRSLSQMLIDQMETIDMHHGVYSADPAYTIIRVVGCEIEPANPAKVDSFNRTADGFEARRPLPPPLVE